MAERPEDGLVAAEGASREARSGRRGNVDPLDGTVTFLYGFPAWCVSVALHDDDGPAVGVVLDPVRDEAFRAVRGKGGDVNGSPLRVRERAELERALVATGFGYDAGRRAWQAEIVARLLPEVRDIRRAGAAALDLAWLSAGRVDAYFERGLSLWDWGAGRLLVEEAGGAIAELPGEPYGIAAANPRLLPALVERVSATGST